MTEDINFLKKFIFFSDMEDRELSQITKFIKTCHYPEGYNIFFEGEEGTGVYFLKEGRVKVIKSSLSGKEQILDILNPGQIFGEVILFGIDKYPATTRTMDNVTVGVLSKELFKDYFKNNQQFAWAMLQEMAQKLYRSQRKIKSLGLRNTKGRVAFLILELFSKQGDNPKKNVSLDINQQEMSDYIGTSRETVSRTLSQFRKQGLIELQRNHLTILDIEGLRKML